MRNLGLLTFACLMAMTFSFGASADSAKRAAEKEDQDWEKVEEPALRPVKGFARGIHALTHHTVRSFAEGNEKFPVLGTVEVFRGIRRGGVELVTRTYKGVAGSKPAPYNKKSKPNQIIEEDLLLRNTADMVTSGLIFAPGAGIETATKTAIVLHGAQFVVDRSPLDPNKKEHEIDRVERAQRSYLGQRPNEHPNRNARENLLKLAK